jgi:hypothetical protein
MNTRASDSTIVGNALADVRARWRTRSALHAASVGAAGLALLWGAGWVALRVAGLAGGRLAALFVLLLAGSAAWVAVVAARRERAPGDRALARHAEELHPGFEDRLVTAVDVSAREAQGPLDGALLADAVRALGREPLDDVAPRESVRAAGIRFAATGVVCAAALAAWIGPAWHALGAVRAFLLPSTVSIHVRPGDARVAPGRPLGISAAIGVDGLVPEITIAAGDRSRRIPMTHGADGRFSTRFDSVPGSFRYSVSAGSARSSDYSVTLLEAPTLQGIDLRYEFPAYTKLPPRDERDGGDIYAPKGTTVRLSVRASAATVGGAIVLGGTRVPLASGDGGPLTATLPVNGDGSYRVALVSRDGIDAPGDTEYFIRVLDDRPPDVRIVRPATDRQVTPLEEVTIEARADDDYGIEAFDLVYSVRGAAQKVVPFAGERTPLTATGRHTVYLEDLGVAPGDFVTYYARARDVGRGKRSSEARSDIYFLEVTPFNQEFAAAQSQAMSQGGGRSMDDLVSAQKDVIVATWKLDRRSGAGRSASDLRTVARAQADVRQRTERASAMMRGPRRRPSGGGAAEADPLGAAAAAMAKAQAALEAANSAAAVGPEMEALNHLLRAQAENRRREVMRQQAGMGGGGNRAQQDLSSLFDRELKRQQQTNYETPKTAQEHEPGREDDLLERLRALAARQEQMARQQDDLAKSGEQLDAEERRRRLERLTREQTELRRQAEQLAQQMQAQRQQGRQESGQPPSRSGAASASDLREASDEMQAAAGELRRDDARQASARSARAAERLRDLERQLQGRAPDERRRALGDLQLEARQLADRQRQIGDEAAAGRGAPDAGDRSRRLAGEQERLADRADRLGQQLDALRKSTPGQGAASLADARKELDSQRVSETMREAARGLREGQREGAARAEAAGRSAARALDRLADRLSDATGQRDAAERKLSDQLARARDVRERMGDLQRQLAELQPQDGQPPGRGQQPRDGQEPRDGQQPRDGQPPGAGSPQDGQQGSRQGRSSSPSPGGQGEGGASPGTSGDQAQQRAREIERLRREYGEQVREAARLRQELAGRQGRQGGGDGRGSTPEGQLMVMSAPGTEAFKQDFSKWDVLHRDVTLGLERLEADLSQQLLQKALRERLAAGTADSAPGEYRDAVERYFRSLASPKE